MTRSLSLVLVFGAAMLVGARLPDAVTLGDAKREQRAAAARSAALERQARAADDAAARTERRARAIVARIEAAEAGITAAEARVRIVETMRADQRARLARRQAPLVRLTAALQTAARRPPALALAQRGSLDDMIHARALLASTVPQVRASTAALRAEIARGDRLREQAGLAVRALARSRAALAEQRGALARLEGEQRRLSSGLSDLAIAQSTRALAFGEAARELFAVAGSRGFQDAVRGRLVDLPVPPLRPEAAQPPLPRALYRLPVAGAVVEGTGELSEGGVHARGLRFDAAPDAEVVAPRAGRILFASRFRDYGGVVIIDHGRGWTSTLTGLAAIGVASGATVVPGDRLGRAGTGDVGLELRRGGRPVALASIVG